jgi:uncharacterized protein involved in outer membrane biogenesis
LKKLIIALVVLVAAVLAAAVAAPWLIDAGQYRAEIAARVSAVIGHKVTIDGPVTFVLLPSPRVRAADVRVVVPAAEAPVSIDAKRVELALGWSALFGRRIEVTSLRVIEPRATVAASATRAPQLGSLAAVRIERTEIENGRIVWHDPAAKTPRTVEQLQATILTSPLASSVRVSGSAVASAVPVEFDAVIGEAPTGRPHPVSLTLGFRPGLARVTLRGSYDADTSALRGRLQIEGDDFYAAAATFGQVPPLLAGVASQPFLARGDVNWIPSGLAVNDVVLQLGELRATGGVNATFGRTLAADVALAMTVVDLDRLARLERRAAAPAPISRPTTGAVRVDMNRAEGPAPPAIDITLDLGIDAVGLNNGTLRQVRLNAVLSRDDLVINRLAALLPGETEFIGFAQIAMGAATPRIDGTLSARSDNLRGLLEWLGLETSGVPAGRLRRFEGEARIEGTPAKVELTGISLAFDSTRATGGIAIALGNRVGLGADLRVDQLNLDGYAIADTPPGQPAGPPLLERFDANLTFAAQTVTWRGEPFNGVSVDALLQGGDLVLRSAVVTDVAGARVEARGTIAAVARQPVADLDVALRADDASRLLRLADLSSLASVPLALTGKLHIAANGEARLEGVDLAYGDSRITGRATLAGTPRRLALELEAGRVMLASLPRIAANDGGIGVDATVKAGSLLWGGQEVKDARIEAHVDPGTPPSIDLTGTLFGGALDFTARPEAPGHGKVGASLTLRNADLRQGLSALLGTASVSGRADLRAALSLPARMGTEIWSGLSGSIELTGRDGALAGIDLPRMRDMLDPKNPPADLVALLSAGLHGGATPFTTLNATARLAQSALAIENLRIATPVGEATGGGSGDLARGTIDLSLTVPVAGIGVPPVQLKVQGPVEEARLAFDFSQLQRYLSQRQGETPAQERESR